MRAALQDMGEAPEAHTIKRIDVNGAYEPATLTLGDVCGRLSADKGRFTLSADFIAGALNITPAQISRNGGNLFTESQFQTICSQLRSHISAMAELYAADTVG